MTTPFSEEEVEEMMIPRSDRSRRHRVAEIFGPTIQGEGRLVGMPCHFVRFGGCDFRCTWCDTPHAVLPELVALLPKMDEWEILNRLLTIDVSEYSWVRWVVLTGGNPGLLDLSYLIELLHKRSYKVMLETQGTTYREWFTEVDDLCFSPKPPSAGNVTDPDLLERIVTRLVEDAARRSHLVGLESFPLPYLKVPIFNDLDLTYATMVHRRFPDLEMFLSIGNTDPSLPTVGNPNPEPACPGHEVATTDVVLDNFKRVLDLVLKSYPGLQDCRIFPQQHTLLWGNDRGH